MTSTPTSTPTPPPPSPSATLTAAVARDLLPEWHLSLRAERKTPGTIAVYTDAAARYLAWCTAGDRLPLTRTGLQQWVVELLDAGGSAATARSRIGALRRFAAWLCATGHLSANPFTAVRAPALDQPVVEPLTDAELRALITACRAPAGTRPRLPHLRDEAIIRLMAETAIRSGETADLTLADLDLATGRITVRRGKGGRGRTIPVGPTTTAAITGYLAAREHHPRAHTPEAWLGDQGKTLGRYGLGRALRRRAARAGITAFRPHRLRHTAAHRWLAAGGSESGLMAMAGWTRTAMLVRYTRANAADRAAAEALRLDLGNL